MKAIAHSESDGEIPVSCTMMLTLPQVRPLPCSSFQKLIMGETVTKIQSFLQTIPAVLIIADVDERDLESIATFRPQHRREVIN
jgi:hypothetical protein